MSTSGSGVGGSLGSPTTLSYRELETTASVGVSKMAMKIVADTVDITFFLLDENLRKYETSSSRQSLGPMTSTRVAGRSESPPDQSWRAVYEQLTKQLPVDVSTLLSLSLQMPLRDRGAHLIVLDNVLRNTAKTLILLGMAATPLNLESSAALLAATNIASPYVAIGSFLRSNRELLGGALALLESLGPNSRNYDTIVSYMTEYNSLSTALESAVVRLQDPKTSKEALVDIVATGAKIANLSDRYDRLYGADEMLLLGATLHAAKLATAALALENPGCAPLLISLSIATLALNDKESAISAIGGSLVGVNSHLASALSTAFLPQEALGSTLLLSQLLNATLMGAVIFGSLSSAQGFGLPALNPLQPEIAAEKNFAYGLVLSLLTESQALKTMGEKIADAVAVPEGMHHKMGDLFATTTLVFLIAAAADRNDPESIIPLIASQHDQLSKGVDSAALLLNDLLQEGKASGSEAEHLSVFLQQASIALHQDDSHAFLEAGNNILALTGSSSHEFLADLGKLSDFAISLQSLLTVSADEKIANTGLYSHA